MEMLGHNIRNLRRLLKLSQQELGAAVGVTGKTIGMWERGDVSSVRRGALQAVARFFSSRLGGDLTPDGLQQRDLCLEGYRRQGRPATGAEPAAGSPLPVLTLEEAAMERDCRPQGGARADGRKFIARPPDLDDPRAYACRMTGDRAAPVIEPGDVILLSPSRPFHDNKIYLLRTLAGEIQVRKAYRRGDHYLLNSLNPNHEPLLFLHEQISSMHQVVWIKKA